MFLQGSIFNFPRPAEFRIVEIGTFVGAVGQLIFLLGLIVFFVIFVLGAVQWISSGGDKGKVQSARERIIQGLVGLAILSLALAVIILLQVFFGITILGDVCLPTAFSDPC